MMNWQVHGRKRFWPSLSTISNAVMRDWELSHKTPAKISCVAADFRKRHLQATPGCSVPSSSSSKRRFPSKYLHGVTTLPGHLPRQAVQRRINQRFDYHPCSLLQGTVPIINLFVITSLLHCQIFLWKVDCLWKGNNDRPEMSDLEVNKVI